MRDARTFSVVLLTRYQVRCPWSHPRSIRPRSVRSDVANIGVFFSRRLVDIER